MKPFGQYAYLPSVCLWVLAGFLLASCSDRTAAPIIPAALKTGIERAVYVGTTREMENGIFGIERSPKLQLLSLSVSLPPDRETGSVSEGGASPKPKQDFVLAGLQQFDQKTQFSNALSRDFSKSSTNEGREVTLYVHGYNNSFADAAFRMAQMSHDLQLEGPVVSYAWPSRGNPLGYEYDADSAIFARDGLVELLQTISDSNPQRIIIVGHSMGSRLVMEAIRQLELTSPGWSAREKVGVLLISPDVNVDVFRSQTLALKSWPEPFIIFGSRRDVLLRISARIRGETERLGNIKNIDEISDLPIVFIDVTAFDDGDAANHFVAGSSGSLLRILRSAREQDDPFLQGSEATSISILGSGRRIGRAIEIAIEPEDR